MSSLAENINQLYRPEARDLWQDHLVSPVQGQLVLLPPQPQCLQWSRPSVSASGQLHRWGSEETHFTDDKPDIGMYRIIVARERAVFGGPHAVTGAGEAAP